MCILLRFWNIRLHPLSIALDLIGNSNNENIVTMPSLFAFGNWLTQTLIIYIGISNYLCSFKYENYHKILTYFLTKLSSRYNALFMKPWLYFSKEWDLQHFCTKLQIFIKFSIKITKNKFVVNFTEIIE